MITVQTMLDTIEDLRKTHKFTNDAQILITDDFCANTRMGRVQVIFNEGDVRVELSKELKHTDPWSIKEQP